jgi:hypothetical protein
LSGAEAAQAAPQAATLAPAIPPSWPPNSPALFGFFEARSHWADGVQATRPPRRRLVAEGKRDAVNRQRGWTGISRWYAFGRPSLTTSSRC